MLFQGFLTPGKSCESCGLDFGFADSGDGPAIFVIFIVGFIIVGAALAVDVMFKPSMLVHMLLWIPATIILSIAFLRPFKGIMINLQYKNDAREGRQTEGRQTSDEDQQG